MKKPCAPRTRSAGNFDALVDRFADAINAHHRDRVSVDVYDVPASVLVGEQDEFCFSDWAIKPFAKVDWIEPLEERLGHRFPNAYRSLITRYIFPSFEAGDVFLFANTPEGTEYHELRDRIFRDEALFRALWPAGYLQFAQPAGGDYDPVCFDLSRGNGDDCPIIRIDHEGILCDDSIEVVAQIAPSFQALIELVARDM